jgi:hypothetical protein
MKNVVVACAVATLAGCMGIPMAMPVGMSSNTADTARLQAELEQSQMQAAAQASRPGDANMDCAAIEAELIAQMRDPKFQAAMASMGSRAESEKAKLDAAMAGGKTVKPDPATAGDYQKGIGADLVTMMPQIMRGQRLNELAQAKQCAFLKGHA